MAKYFVVSGFRQELSDRLDAVPHIIQEESEAMGEEIGEIGVEAMVGQFLLSETDFSRAAQAVGLNIGPGRQRTGRLLSSYDFRVESGPSLTRVVVGYLNNFQDYFMFQEEGYENVWRGSYDAQGRLRLEGGTPRVFVDTENGPKETEGIFALVAARNAIEMEMPRLIKKYKTRITKRINRGG